MRRVLWFWFIVAIGIGSLMLTGCVRSGDWTSRFVMEGDELVSIGRNPYFILEPGYQLVLEGGGTQLIITVLNETKMVDGVETRVVEERNQERPADRGCSQLLRDQPTDERRLLLRRRRGHVQGRQGRESRWVLALRRERREEIGRASCRERVFRTV